MATKDKVYYWNDPTMSLGAKIKEGDVIPADYIKKNPEKFKALCESGQISDKKKVKFEEKKHRELSNLHGEVDKLKRRIVELLKKQGLLEEEINENGVNLKDLENLDSIKDELTELRAEKKLWDDFKIESQKKIGDFHVKLTEAFGKSSISKDDKTSLLEILADLQKEKDGE